MASNRQATLLFALFWAQATGFFGCMFFYARERDAYWTAAADASHENLQQTIKDFGSLIPRPPIAQPEMPWYVAQPALLFAGVALAITIFVLFAFMVWRILE